jgi:outer membrane protein OmpA-like peptidoglycan-associated protein
MSDPDDVLGRLVDALSRGDRTAALACFAPGATVVVSGAHHDYSSYRPEAVVDVLLFSFIEPSWTPSVRRTVGGARVEEGALGATQIGPFLGVEPRGERVVANLRVSGSLGAGGALDTLSVWGSREAVLGQIGGVVGAAEMADTLVAAARERHADGVRDYTQEELAAFPLPPLPAGTRVAPVAGAGTPARPAMAARSARARVSPRRLLLWGGGALALTALLVGVVQVTLRLLPGADAVAGNIAVSVVTPTARATSIATIPPIVDQNAKQGVAGLGGSTGPFAPGTVLTGSSNAGLAVVGPNVQFDYDSAVIRPQAQADIEALATAIITRGLSGAIYVHGYTDNLGSHEHGIVLSSQRATAVAKLLQDRLRGQPVTLVVGGYGEQDPVADNSTPEGQMLNRRVMVLYKPAG